MNAFFRPLLPRLPFVFLSGRELISPRETNRSWMNVDERVPVELKGRERIYRAPSSFFYYFPSKYDCLLGGEFFDDERTKLFWGRRGIVEALILLEGVTC